MPSIVSPGTPTQDQNTVLEALDWQPPCEYISHEVHGHGPATLIVWLGPTPCHCRPTVDAISFCDPCWTYRVGQGLVRCRACFCEWPAMSNVLRLERI